MKKKFLFVSIFLFFTFKCFAYQLRGYISDEHNNPIPYASVYVNQSTYGVSSNLKGEYSLELKNGKYEIVYTSMGVEKKIIEVIIENKSQELNVKLLAVVTELKEISISDDGKDPAYEVIRNAIKSRDKYRYPANQYSCNAYIKSSLEREDRKKKNEIADSLFFDSIPLTKQKMNFVESYSNVYYRPPYSFKEIKTAYKDFSEKFESNVTIAFSTGKDDHRQVNFVNTNLFKLNLADAEFNFYNNNLDIPTLGANPYISPISSFGFLSYHYHLEDYFYEDGYWINKIQITPRRTDGALFSGYIYIVDDLWCIKSIDLSIDPATLYLFNHFRLFQNYDVLNDSIWILSQEEFFFNSKEGSKNILGNTYIKYSDYNLKPEIAKGFFNNELSSIVDDAYEKDSMFWHKIRPITLKNEEMKFIIKQDSIENYHKSVKYLNEQDSIANKHNIWDYLFELNFQNSIKKQELHITGLLMSANIFGIGGYRQLFSMGYRKEWTKAYKLETDGKLNYGFTNEDLKGNINASFMYLPKRFARLHASYRDEYDFVNSYEALTQTFTLNNYINIVTYSIGHEMELINGLFLDAQIDYANKKSIAGIEGDAWFEWWSNGLFGETNNEPMDFEGYEQLLVDITLKYTPAQKYYTEPYKKVIIGSKYPTFALNYRKGIKGVFNSVADFDFLELRITDNTKLGTWGQSRYNIYLGKFLNNNSVLFTEDKFFRGSDPYLFSNALKSFQLLGPSLHTSNPYLQLHYLHRFNGVLLNKVPFVKKLHLIEVAGAGALLIQDNNFRHAEVFGGLEKTFKIRKQLFRIGVYYVVADSNYSDLAGSIKFGIDFYDSFRNSWTY
jgi:hypothetical protein